LKAILAGASSNLSGVAEINDFAVSEITSALIAHYDHTPFWIFAGMLYNKSESIIANTALCIGHIRTRCKN